MGVAFDSMVEPKLSWTGVHVDPEVGPSGRGGIVCVDLMAQSLGVKDEGDWDVYVTCQSVSVGFRGWGMQ